jgi:hypothetical protein
MVWSGGQQCMMTTLLSSSLIFSTPSFSLWEEGKRKEEKSLRAFDLLNQKKWN